MRRCTRTTTGSVAGPGLRSSLAANRPPSDIGSSSRSPPGNSKGPPHKMLRRVCGRLPTKAHAPGTAERSRRRRYPGRMALPIEMKSRRTMATFGPPFWKSLSTASQRSCAPSKPNPNALVPAAQINGEIPPAQVRSNELRPAALGVPMLLPRGVIDRCFKRSARYRNCVTGCAPATCGLWPPGALG